MICYSSNRKLIPQWWSFHFNIILYFCWFFGIIHHHHPTPKATFKGRNASTSRPNLNFYEFSYIGRYNYLTYDFPHFSKSFYFLFDVITGPWNVLFTKDNDRYLMVYHQSLVKWRPKIVVYGGGGYWWVRGIQEGTDWRITKKKHIIHSCLGLQSLPIYHSRYMWNKHIFLIAYFLSSVLCEIIFKITSIWYYS